MKYLIQMTVLAFKTAISLKSNSAIRSFTKMHRDREKAVPLFWPNKQKSQRRVTNQLLELLSNSNLLEPQPTKKRFACYCQGKK